MGLRRRCVIAATTGTGDSFRLAYHDTDNLVVLSSVISSARQRPGLQKLSELLND